MGISSVLVSILNWNKAEVTIKCLESVKKMACNGLKVDILVIDNGSNQADYAGLRNALPDNCTQFLRIEKNLGFTGGHNESLKVAIRENYDYVWLLNNDATVEPDTLVKLVDAIANDTRCGAVSPFLISEEGPHPDIYTGLIHNWEKRDAAWLTSEEVIPEQLNHPESICVAGTAILLRVQAIREVGLLDDRLFAYYDDNDIGVRLSRGGWHSKVVLETTCIHDSPPLAERPPYFFYLMFRNELIFWHTHMPKNLRKLLWLKLVNQSLYKVNRLRRRGMERQADSALLGVSDFIFQKTGAPRLPRSVPLATRLVCAASAWIHKKQLNNEEARFGRVAD
jgi:GT2 family glycosyltransferase